MPQSSDFGANNHSCSRAGDWSQPLTSSWPRSGNSTPRPSASLVMKLYKHVTSVMDRILSSENPTSRSPSTFASFIEEGSRVSCATKSSIVRVLVVDVCLRVIVHYMACQNRIIRVLTEEPSVGQSSKMALVDR